MEGRRLTLNSNVEIPMLPERGLRRTLSARLLGRRPGFHAASPTAVQHLKQGAGTVFGSSVFWSSLRDSCLASEVQQADILSQIPYETFLGGRFCRKQQQCREATSTIYPSNKFLRGLKLRENTFQTFLQNWSSKANKLLGEDLFFKMFGNIGTLSTS